MKSKAFMTVSLLSILSAAQATTGDLFTSPSIKLDSSSINSSIVFRGGSDIGGGNLSIDDLYEWCEGASTVLSEALSTSRVILQSSGNYQVANLALRQGYIDAMDEIKNKDTSILTFRSLERGILLMDFAEVDNTNNSEVENQALNEYLTLYTQFIIQDVIDDLDLNFHIPYHYNSDFKSIEQYEKRYIRYAKQQLLMFNNYFIVPINKYQVSAKAPKKYLKMVEVMSISVKEDIEDSFWKDLLSCARLTLQSINQKIAPYNQGDTTIYANDRIAVNLIFKDYINVLENLNGCQ